VNNWILNGYCLIVRKLTNIKVINIPAGSIWQSDQQHPGLQKPETVETETANGKWNRIFFTYAYQGKPLNNHHLLKTTYAKTHSN